MKTNVQYMLLSFMFALLGAFALVGCLGGQTVGVGPVDGDPNAGVLWCQPGVAYPSANCRGDCPNGQFPGLRCPDSRNLAEGVCGCYGSVVVNPPSMVCNPTEVRYGFIGATCRSSCSAGQTTSETCVGNAWADCRCIPRPDGCAPNSITFNGCGAVCNIAGEEAGQLCNPTGTGYGSCACFRRNGGGTAQTCMPGNERTCDSPVVCTSGLPRLVCNAAGTGWSACQCVGGTAQVCIPGSTSGSCTCPGTGTGGTRVCNAAGTEYYCSACTSVTTCGSPGLQITVTCSSRNATQPCPTSGHVWHQVCRADGVLGDCQCAPSGGGGSTGSRFFRLEVDGEFWRYERNDDGTIVFRDGRSAVFCELSSLNVRCFDGTGEQVASPITLDRRINLRDWKAGVVNCDVTCGNAVNAPVHPLLRRGGWNNVVATSSRGIRVISVTGGVSTAAMADQIGTARYCPATGGTKLQGAVNADRLGICS